VPEALHRPAALQTPRTLRPARRRDPPNRLTTHNSFSATCRVGVGGRAVRGLGGGPLHPATCPPIRAGRAGARPTTRRPGRGPRATGTGQRRCAQAPCGVRRRPTRTQGSPSSRPTARHICAPLQASGAAVRQPQAASRQLPARPFGGPAHNRGRGWGAACPLRCRLDPAPSRPGRWPASRAAASRPPRSRVAALMSARSACGRALTAPGTRRPGETRSPRAGEELGRPAGQGGGDADRRGRVG
jgi:hypothetical protein